MSEVGVVNCLATDATYTDDTPVNYVFPQQPLKGKVSINNNNENNNKSHITAFTIGSTSFEDTDLSTCSRAVCTNVSHWSGEEGNEQEKRIDDRFVP